MPDNLRPGEQWCARCLLGHPASPWSVERPEEHHELAEVTFHGNSLCQNCYMTLSKLLHGADW